MQRILSFLVALTFATAAAAPAVACVGGDAAAGAGSCCGQQADPAVVPAAPCCSMSIPQQLAVSESRTIGARHDQLDLPVASEGASFETPDAASTIPRSCDISARGIRRVPIYLIQLALLI